MSAQTLLLGLGNLLFRDEGLGIRALERLLERYRLPPAVQPLDGGVMGLELLNYLDDAERVLVIDAVRTGQPPGSLVRLADAEIPKALSLKMSMHQVNFQEALALGQLRGKQPAQLLVCGMEPELLEAGTELSATVAARLDSLVAAVIATLQDWELSVVSVAETEKV